MEYMKDYMMFKKEELPEGTHVLITKLVEPSIAAKSCVGKAGTIKCIEKNRIYSANSAIELFSYMYIVEFADGGELMFYEGELEVIPEQLEFEF